MELSDIHSTMRAVQAHKRIKLPKMTSKTKIPKSVLHDALMQ